MAFTAKPFTCKALNCTKAQLCIVFFDMLSFFGLRVSADVVERKCRSIASHTKVAVRGLNPKNEVHSTVIASAWSAAAVFTDSSIRYMAKEKGSEVPAHTILLLAEDLHSVISNSGLPKHEKEKLVASNYLEFYSLCLDELAGVKAKRK